MAYIKSSGGGGRYEPGPDKKTYFSGSGYAGVWPGTGWQRAQNFMSTCQDYSSFNNGCKYKIAKGGNYHFNFSASGYNESGDRGTVQVRINGTSVAQITYLGVDRNTHSNNFNYDVPDDSYVELYYVKNQNNASWSIGINLSVYINT